MTDNTNFKHRNQIPVFILTLLTSLQFISIKAQQLFDISPDSKNGIKITSSIGFTAGLTYEIAGNKNELYAVSLNAGVWKTETQEGSTFAKWRQLENTPRYSSCIAADPQFANHIVVGERLGDHYISNSSNSYSGIWESFDGGATFDNKYFLPYLNSSGQSIKLGANDYDNYPVSDIIITNKSTTIAATPFGIARREMLGKWEKTLTADITAIAFYETWIVARSINQIFLSNDDGKTWKWKEFIPVKYSSSEYDLALDREGKYSVSILASKKHENIFVYIPASNKDTKTNYPSLLIYKLRADNISSHWSNQDISIIGRGTGLGGRIFIKSFLLQDQTLKNDIGGKSQLIFCVAQDLLKAINITKDGHPDWELFTSTYGSDAPNKKIHNDIWDFHIDPLGWYIWAATDGGVHYQKLDENNPNRFTGLNPYNAWYNLNEGLHTHHIHSAFVSDVSSNPVRISDKVNVSSHFGYGTQDNDLWISDANGKLTPSPATGDVNWVCGDRANSAFISGGRHFQQFVFKRLDPNASIPSGSKIGNDWLVLNYCTEFNGFQCFQFIQTLASENVPEYLDAVALTRLPLQHRDNRGGGNLINVPGAIGQLPGSLAIIRNKNFAKNPDINASKGNGWDIEFNNLPSGVLGFWVSGGHANPTYYILCVQNGNTRIFKRKKSDSNWTSITTMNNLAINPLVIGLDRDGYPVRTEFGPIFINPFKPEQIYVSCKDGIYYSNDGGATAFTKDIKLTDLVAGTNPVTNKFSYPIDRAFSGGNGSGVCWSTQANGMCPLSSMSFNRTAPEQIAASSPFTGVFYKNGSKSWTNLSYLLPKPFTPVSSVNINTDGIFITTEGRGFLLIKNY